DWRRIRHRPNPAQRDILLRAVRWRRDRRRNPGRHRWRVAGPIPSSPLGQTPICGPKRHALASIPHFNSKHTNFPVESGRKAALDLLQAKRGSGREGIEPGPENGHQRGPDPMAIAPSVQELTAGSDKTAGAQSGQPWPSERSGFFALFAIIFATFITFLD